MRLEFDAAAHQYRIDGRRVPSVTEVLEPLQDFGGASPDVLRAAADFGTHVHEACALLVRGELDWDALDVALVPYVIGAQRFLDESGFVVIAAELRVGHAELRYAGTLDLLGEWRGQRALVDWKSGAVPRTVGPQTSGYAMAYHAHHGEQVRRRYCVELKPHGYAVHSLSDSGDRSIFLSALNCHHWRHRDAA